MLPRVSKMPTLIYYSSVQLTGINLILIRILNNFFLNFLSGVQLISILKKSSFHFMIHFIFFPISLNLLNPATFYWSASIKQVKWAVIYMCITGIYFFSIFDLSIGVWSFSDSEVSLKLFQEYGIFGTAPRM